MWGVGGRRGGRREGETPAQARGGGECPVLPPGHSVVVNHRVRPGAGGAVQARHLVGKRSELLSVLCAVHHVVIG